MTDYSTYTHNFSFFNETVSLDEINDFFAKLKEHEYEFKSFVKILDLSPHVSAIDSLIELKKQQNKQDIQSIDANPIHFNQIDLISWWKQLGFPSSITVKEYNNVFSNIKCLSEIVKMTVEKFISSTEEELLKDKEFIMYLQNIIERKMIKFAQAIRYCDEMYTGSELDYCHIPSSFRR